MKPKASTKLANLYSRCSLPSTTFHPSSPLTAAWISSSFSFVGLALIPFTSFGSHITIHSKGLSRYGSLFLERLFDLFADRLEILRQQLFLFRCQNSKWHADESLLEP